MSYYDDYGCMYGQTRGGMPLPSFTPQSQFPTAGPPIFPPAPQIGTSLPTGMPAGTPMNPMPTSAMIPIPSQAPTGELAPQTTESPLYTPGFMRTQIGRNIKVEFLIGTNMLVDREGTLLAVGASYIIIRETDTDDLLLCDLYSIKFVRFYY